MTKQKSFQLNQRNPAHHPGLVWPPSGDGSPLSAQSIGLLINWAKQRPFKWTRSSCLQQWYFHDWLCTWKVTGLFLSFVAAPGPFHHTGSQWLLYSGRNLVNLAFPSPFCRPIRRSWVRTLTLAKNFKHKFQLFDSRGDVHAPGYFHFSFPFNTFGFRFLDPSSYSWIYSKLLSNQRYYNAKILSYEICSVQCSYNFRTWASSWVFKKIMIAQLMTETHCPRLELDHVT